MQVYYIQIDSDRETTRGADVRNGICFIHCETVNGEITREGIVAMRKGLFHQRGKMRKRWMAAGLAALLAASQLTGCGVVKNTEDRENTENGENIESMEKQENIDNTDKKESVTRLELSAAGYQSPFGNESATAQTAAKGANAFALEMGSTLYKEYKGENFICSPFSLWLPLAALLNTTDEEGTQKLLQALEMEGLSVEEVNEAASRMMYSLNGGFWSEEDSDFKPALRFANMVFVNQEYEVNRQFAQQYLDSYGGEIMAVDFTQADAVEEINSWAKEQTAGRVERIVEKLEPDTVAAIANTIYFQDKWSHKFNKDLNEKAIFYGKQGEQEAEYMVKEGRMTYYENDMIQAVALGFQQGDSIYILLPKEMSASELYTSLQMEDLDEIFNGMNYIAEGLLKLPKFEIQSSSMDLLELLEELGVPLMDRQNPHITDLVTNAEEPLYITDAVQKAMISLDEEGTTAAAVTVLAAMEGAAMIPEPEEKFEMICNKPFVFLLVGNTYDGREQILFTGVVNQP